MTTADEDILRVEGLDFAYPDGTVALRGIDLEIHRGEFLAIIGQNGSGKTTLAKHFNGLLKPSEGDVIIFGMNTKNASVAETTSRVGYVFQNPDHQLCHRTVEEEAAFGPKNLGLSDEEIKNRVNEQLKFFDLEARRNEDPFFLSKAERQRLAIASVLAMHPELIVVDEPTTGMDHRQSVAMLELLDELNKKGYGVVIITHNMQLVAEYAKRVIVMLEGRVCLDGSPREAFTKTEILEKTFLKPPQIARLSLMLSDFGFGVTLNTKEFVETLNEKSIGTRRKR